MKIVWSVTTCSSDMKDVRWWWKKDEYGLKICIFVDKSEWYVLLKLC